MALSLDEHLLLVLNETYEARTKWYNIGLGLKVSVDTLDSIRGSWDDDGERLREMFKPWLKGLNPVPTWTSLTAVLRSPSVGEDRLAEKLEGNFCPGSEETKGTLIFTLLLVHSLA